MDDNRFVHSELNRDNPRVTCRCNDISDLLDENHLYNGKLVTLVDYQGRAYEAFIVSIKKEYELLDALDYRLLLTKGKNPNAMLVEFEAIGYTECPLTFEFENMEIVAEEYDGVKRNFTNSFPILKRVTKVHEYKKKLE